MSESHPELKFHLYSFGFKHPSMLERYSSDGGFVIDCRPLPNPYWVESLSKYSGKEQPVQEFFQQHESVNFFIHAVKNLLESAALAHRVKKLNEEQVCSVYLGCTGGRHRSVYVAESLSKALKESGRNCCLTHLDIEKE